MPMPIMCMLYNITNGFYLIINFHIIIYLLYIVT
jgi:hypothetical protein